MSNISPMIMNLKPNSLESNQRLAEAITHSASQQTYYTVRLLADRDRVEDAYRAYAYFRWVDDQLDQGEMNKHEQLRFVERQQALIERCYRGEISRDLTNEETMLSDLIRSDHEPNSGLQTYIRNLMAVLSFDAQRRGRLITYEELDQYTHLLAIAVTEALHYFIGKRCPSPHCRTRYLAVTAAHITHMLRDTLEDVQAGYFNIPREYLDISKINPEDVQSEPYRKWIQSRVNLARSYFRFGRKYFARVKNLRCRIAGYAYMARFETVLSAIERNDYLLRPAYPECKNLSSALWMSWSTISQAFVPQPV